MEVPKCSLDDFTHDELLRFAKDSDRNNKYLTKKVKELEKENHALKEDSIDSMIYVKEQKNKIEALQTELEEYKESNEDIKADNLRLYDEAEALQKEVEELKLQVRDMKACAEIAVTAGKMLTDKGE